MRSIPNSPRAAALTLAALAALALATTAAAKVQTKKVSWEEGGTSFDGVLVWDEGGAAKKPGLVMVPNWYGVNDAAVEKAGVLAGTDYVILVADVYGRGLRPKNAEEAGKASSAAGADAAVIRARANKALAALRGAEGVPLDAQRIGAIGFCFGGMVALELARSGADLDGVATFHANLSTKAPAAAGAIKAPVLAMNGADDSFVPAAQIDGFEKEMREAKADWQFVNFGGAKHCFAEPDEHGQVPGCEYHAPSYTRSVALMRDFFTAEFAAARN
jgi:dienelactone hydrolase